MVMYTASNVWGTDSNTMRKWTTMVLSWWKLWKQMVDRLTTQELEMNTIIAKQIWIRRNIYVFQEKF